MVCSSEITCPVISPRAFVAVTAKGRSGDPTISALYDTGAQTSILSLQDYHRLVRAGVPFVDFPTSQFRLQAANGTLMAIHQVISIPESIGPLTVSISFVVTSGTHCSILGMNAITTFDLAVCDGVLVSRLGDASEAQPLPTHTIARRLQKITLGCREGTVAAMAMCRPDGPRIREECEAVLDTGVAAVLIKTDRNGEFIGPCSNFSQSTVQIPTSPNVRTIASTSDYSFLGQSEAATIALSQPVAPHTKAQIQEVHRLLAGNVHRNTPPHHRARILELLYKYQDCFSCSKDDIGRCDILQHEIHLDTDKPIFIPQFRLSSQHFAAIKTS